VVQILYWKPYHSWNRGGWCAWNVRMCTWGGIRPRKYMCCWARPSLCWYRPQMVSGTCTVTLDLRGHLLGQAPQCLHTACRPTSRHFGLLQASSWCLLRRRGQCPHPICQGHSNALGKVVPSPVGSCAESLSWQWVVTSYCLLALSVVPMQVSDQPHHVGTP